MTQSRLPNFWFLEHLLHQPLTTNLYNGATSASIAHNVSDNMTSGIGHFS